MKVLIIRYKLTRGVPEGGEQASEKNRQAIGAIVGPSNTETYYIHDEAHRRTLWEYIQGILFMPLGYYFGLTPRRAKEIVGKANGFDVVFIDRSIFGIIARLLKRGGYEGRIVCFFHNVEEVYFKAKYSNPLNPIRWLTTYCANRNDRWSCRYADDMIALSQRDDEQLYQRYHRHADQLIPIAFDDQYQLEHYPTDLIPHRPLCMFLGAHFPANVEGIEWFVKKVLPQVDIQMLIVGKGMNQLREAAWMRPDIEILSDVPDLKPLFEKADLMILPIFKGSGMKVKTCESLMYGKNILGTTEAWSGYELDYSQAGALCDTSDEFVQAIQRYASQHLPRFNTYSRHVFTTKYSTQQMLSKFRSALGME